MFISRWETRRYAYKPVLIFEIFLNFAYFLKSWVLSYFANQEALIRFASSDNNLILFHFDERKICSNGKHVLKYFMSGCLKNVLLLPISIKMYQNSKNVHTLKEKGKKNSTKFVIVLYQSSKISSCVHSLHLNKYLVET